VNKENAPKGDSQPHQNIPTESVHFSRKTDIRRNMKSARRQTTALLR
jgi:hypothetical protein